MMIKSEGWRKNNRQPSKIASHKAKKRDFQKDWEKAMENSQKSKKIRRTCGQLKTVDFMKKYRKTAGNKSKKARFRLFFGQSGG